jgi:flagellar basal-body rod protein FlgB
MTASNVSDLLYHQLAYRSDRQKVISSNIANINTPNYKTKDISFEKQLTQSEQSTDLALTVTNKNHIAFDQTTNTNLKTNQIYEVQGLESQNDGNNVNLDQQISEMAKNSVMQSAITNSITKDSRWFKLVVDSSGKN